MGDAGNTGWTSASEAHLLDLCIHAPRAGEPLTIPSPYISHFPSRTRRPQPRRGIAPSPASRHCRAAWRNPDKVHPWVTFRTPDRCIISVLRVYTLPRANTELWSKLWPTTPTRNGSTTCTIAPCANCVPTVNSLPFDPWCWASHWAGVTPIKAAWRMSGGLRTGNGYEWEVP